MGIVPNPKAVAEAAAALKATEEIEAKHQAQLEEKNRIVYWLKTRYREYTSENTTVDIEGVKTVLKHRGIPMVLLAPELFLAPKHFDQFLVLFLNDQPPALKTTYFHDAKWQFETVDVEKDQLADIVANLDPEVTVQTVEALHERFYREAEEYGQRYKHPHDQIHTHYFPDTAKRKRRT
jgi:hypothetical protein